MRTASDKKVAYITRTKCLYLLVVALLLTLGTAGS